MTRKILTFLANLWIKNLRYVWSSIRHYNSPKQLTLSQLKKFDMYFSRNIVDVEELVMLLFSRFEYVRDPWHRLFDSILPPASAWLKAMEKPPLKDDCDGYHSALYMATFTYLEPKLLTVVTSNIKNSHTILVILDNDNYYFVDYWYLSKSFNNIEDLLEHIYYIHKEVDLEIITHEFSSWSGSRWVSHKRGI